MTKPPMTCGQVAKVKAQIAEHIITNHAKKETSA